MLDLKTITERVNDYIRQHNLTRKGFAELLDMSNVSLWAKLTGRTSFRTDEYGKLCDVLGVNDWNLFRSC